MDRLLVSLCFRATELSEAQRLAMDRAREILRPHFPRETVRLYIPGSDAKARAEQRRRILRALKAGEAPAAIAKREGVGESTVRRMRGRIGSLAHLPP